MDKIGLASKLVATTAFLFFMTLGDQGSRAADLRPFGFTFGITLNELASRTDIKRISMENTEPNTPRYDARLKLISECKKNYDLPSAHLTRRVNGIKLFEQLLEAGWKEKDLLFHNFLSSEDAQLSFSFPQQEKLYEAALSRSRELYLFRDEVTEYEYCVVFGNGKLAAVFVDFRSDLELKNQIQKNLVSKLRGRQLSSRFLTSGSFMHQYSRGWVGPDQMLLEDTLIMSLDGRYFFTGRTMYGQSSALFSDKLFGIKAQDFDQTYEHAGIIDLHMRKLSADTFGAEIPEISQKISKYRAEISAKREDRENSIKARTQARQRILDSVTSESR